MIKTGKPKLLSRCISIAFSFNSLSALCYRTLVSCSPFMADAENISAVSAEDDAQYGFKRPEMYTSNLADTVSPYGRHVFLCYKSPDAWASRVEDEDLPKLLASALKARKADIAVETKLTICEGGESDGDVLIFPEMIKYKGLKESDADAFVEDVLVNGKPWSSGIQEFLAGSYVFVCAHASRDKRCGVCGPALIEKFKQEIESRGLSGQIFVRSCSHLGGHKYAGNLVIYSPDLAGNEMGHWYGYVTPGDVVEMLDQHIAKGEVIQRLWRGQMGLRAEETEKGDEQKLPNGSNIEKSKKTEEGNTQEEKGIVGGCCQGANGVSCCREENMEAVGKKGLLKLPSWIGSLDRNELVTGAGVIGAVATVAVAYRFYRRSG